MIIVSELSIAKEAALAAGNLLITNKDSLLQMIKSSARDIKLQADISAEKKIIEGNKKQTKVKRSLSYLLWYGIFGYLLDAR